MATIYIRDVDPELKRDFDVYKAKHQLKASEALRRLLDDCGK
jgi:hypothetical protein